jgi:hypothetical protein
MRAQIRAHGIGEDRPLDFHTPYGCSKGAADQYVLDYARSFGLRTAVLRMSCIYGQRQMGTEDQGWVAHFLIRAIEGEPITLYGDGHQVRDILDVSNAVDAYLAAWQRIDAIRAAPSIWGRARPMRSACGSCSPCRRAARPGGRDRLSRLARRRSALFRGRYALPPKRRSGLRDGSTVAARRRGSREWLARRDARAPLPKALSQRGRGGMTRAATADRRRVGGVWQYATELATR